MNYEPEQLRKILEGALLAAGHPLTISRLQSLFEPADKAADDETLHPEVPSKELVQAALEDIQSACESRGFELREVGSGWRFQVREEMAPWVNHLWDEKPQRYSRALLETLALIAYRQPITRGDIEEIRGVAVSSHIIKTLVEREWVKVIGHRDVPGRPSLYATTRQFLDYFNIKNLEDLPTLGEIRDLDELNKELDLGIEAQIAKSAAQNTEVGKDSENGHADADADVEGLDSTGLAATDSDENVIDNNEAEIDTVESDVVEIDAAESDDVEINAAASDDEAVDDLEADDTEIEKVETSKIEDAEKDSADDQDIVNLDNEQEENPDPDFDDSFESAPATEEHHDA